MPSIAALTIFPVKSCAGIALQEATLTESGLAVDGVYDREWMVVSPDGLFLSQREWPRMATIVPRIKSETLELRAPGMLALELPLGLPHPDDARPIHVQVWDDRVLGHDCGELAATWFSKALGTVCRLVRFHADAQRATSTKWTDGVAAPTMFADGYPVLLASSASLEDLNGKLRAAGRAALAMDRFRANIVIDGMEAFEEDYAAALVAGEAVLKPVKPCERCTIPAVDQSTGVPGPDPVDILRSYRAKQQMDGAICFGMNAIVTGGAGALLRVGQQVNVELAF